MHFFTSLWCHNTVTTILNRFSNLKFVALFIQYEHIKLAVATLIQNKNPSKHCDVTTASRSRRLGVILSAASKIPCIDPQSVSELKSLKNSIFVKLL